MENALESALNSPVEAAEQSAASEFTYTDSGSWAVQYKSPGRWIFDISVPNQAKQKELLKSFIQIVNTLNIPAEGDSESVLLASREFWQKQDVLIDAINRFMPIPMTILISLYFMINAHMITWLPSFGDSAPVAVSAPAATVPVTPAPPVVLVTKNDSRSSGGRGGAHQHRRTIPPPQAVVSTGKPVPQTLSVSQMGNDHYKISWESVGDGYKYRVYTAKTPDMSHAHLKTYSSLDTPEYKWNAAGKDVWIAVSAVKGIWDEGPLSHPIHIDGR